MRSRLWSWNNSLARSYSEMEKSARITSRAPASGLKLMLAVVIVFAFLAGYGQWNRAQRSKAITTTIIPAPNESPASSPNEQE